MHRFQSLVVKNMDNKRLYENGIRRRPKNYELLKMFSPHAFCGSGGRHDVDAWDQRGYHVDKDILNKFYRRFPQLRLMPQIYHMTMRYGVNAPYNNHPA
jgi:hypothetical protein